MARKNSLKVFAPASIGNVSVGFDALGLAIAPVDGALLGDTVILEDVGADDWALKTCGRFADALPADPEQNVVLKCCRVYQAALAERDAAISCLRVTLEKNLPIGSGLGSSASSIVATLEALNRYNEHPLSTNELFHLMAHMEGGISGDIHLDNIAPCLYGGLRLCPPGSPVVYPLPWPGHWSVVVCWPGTSLETRVARSVLPERIDRGTAVLQAAKFASFIHALHTGQPALAAGSLSDLVAEPYRRKLLPGFTEAKTALADLGALAFGISGSGPTVFAVVDDFEVGNAVEVWLANNYRKNDKGFVHVCRADLGGARSIE